MNVVRVQYEIHDVVREEPKRGKSRRPQTAPFSQNGVRIKTANTTSNGTNLKHPGVDVPKYVPQEVRAQHDFPLPKKPTSSQLSRRNPHPVQRSDKPGWNSSLTVPDRDLLIIDQDLEVARFRESNHFFDEGEDNKPEPALAPIHTRKNSKQLESEEHRDRWVHHSFGAVANNPLPFYPHLHETSGIHADRWKNNANTTVGYDDWAKPASKGAKTQQDFHKDFRSPARPVPIQDVRMQHSFASIESTYTKADARIRGSSKGVLHK